MADRKSTPAAALGWDRRDAGVLELEITNKSSRAQPLELTIGAGPARPAPDLGRRLAAAALRGAVAGFAVGFALAWLLLR